ncbi:alpha/beta hydrolase [Nocardia sp. CDC153]|uniref:alpha/beta fold hydrolase n=1 Tax=Nocardia sp. CDC153 TaxID=3112167 RepID=UPI002DB679AA|nr:alpha/beta hydrolase [Nocardia sp. CDC153]MEC3957372.1 alpha/beta hydrolase [Nocardia sp. CDC153]
MTRSTSRVADWQRAGTLETIGGHRIFVRERDGDPDLPPLLFLHGYPSSSYDWREAFERIEGHRLVVFDFLGFGLSDKPRDELYSLRIQADIAEEVARRFDGAPVVLVSHDMGSSVATELLARDIDGKLSFTLASALLFNASMVREQASLLITQKLLLSRFGPVLARLTNKPAFLRSFASIFSPSHPLTPEEAADQWALLTHNGGHRLLDKLIHYNRERVTPPTSDRWHNALRDWPGRLELAWAELDPICTEAVLRAVLALRPHTALTRLPGLGHYPQLEDPQRVYDLIQRHASQS